jgi:thioredoxin reductase/2,4-dienoyl-CoA reductase-like NADH-dependent reductase (Old Yellow Enzyme family)
MNKRKEYFMNLIRSLMGRRQFLIAAGVTSTAALAYKKLTKVVDPGFQTSIAMASGSPETAAVKGASNRYYHLLSPLKIRNVVLKNRIIHTVGAPPHFLQGPETFPSDVIRSFYANVAKGAAIVACRITGATGLPRKERMGDNAHMAMFDTSDPAVMNYIDQLVEGVHAMGSLVIGGNLGGGKNIATQAKLLEDTGIDVVGMGGGVTNIRDKNAVRSLIEQMQAVKNATNLLISMSLSVQHPLLRPETSDSYTRNAPTQEEVIAAAKMLEGSVDILQIRPATAMGMHPTSWNQEKGKPMALSIVQAIKESGAKIYLSPNGGFRDPDFNEECIASGKCDMITMSRPWIADPEYGKKVYEGRGEEVVPCLMCDKCHGLSMEGPWYTVCSVNPKLGLESAIKVIEAPTASKKVAIIGGGPAGMKAAITAAERGHKVTLYEKNASLGGLLHHADFSPFKWTLKDYKDYLIRQIKKAGVEVILSTEATPDMIKAKGYDAVLAAIGAEPNIPRIFGVDGKNVYNVVNVYGKEKELGKNVVVVGGGEFGVETGMYLAKFGHKVTMLTSEKELLRVDRVHYPEIVIDIYEQMDNFDFITEAIATSISEGKVTYKDARGSEKSIQADSVVIYAGLKPRQDEALKFSGSAKNAFFSIGDCTSKGGNVQKSIRSAFFMASQI